MSWIPALVATLFFLLGGLCVLGVLVQLPGTWVLLLLAGAVELLDRFYLPPEETTTFGWPVLLVCVALAGIGELLEFLASAMGLKRGGGSSRGLWGSLIGGILGLFVFSPLFVFVPIVGTFLAVLLGTFVGAFLGEFSHQRATLHTAWRPALWAAIGRLAGTTGKIGIAVVMWLVLTVSAYWR